MPQSRLLVSLLLLFAPNAFAGDKPNALSAKQAGEGCLLLFDGETTLGWTSPDGSKWSAAEGALKGPEDKRGLLQTTTIFLDGELSFEYQAGEDSQAEVLAGVAPIVKDGLERAKIASLRPTKGWSPIALAVKEKRGRIALVGKDVSFRGIIFKPAGARSLFNGKDLTGWKVFKPEKYKSKFTVTSQGELNVKDGPGDIQTEGKFDDFLLQLECISNGKHLNSGIFFRCKPDEYQNGYEAQIRNQFTPEATQDYLVEVYEPMTHKLFEKRKVKSPAFDFGTGAIYRRIPARKEASKDGEWFTLTVAAQGNHFSTWVNGIQQVDWLDNRAPSDNPRTGFRAQAGHISIQGHDPTTDLSFRNFRIVECK